jgi:methyl-accepting chemotaxis protein
MAHSLAGNSALGGSILVRGRAAMARISLAGWMLILVVVALSGYAVFGLKYYLADHQHRKLLSDNSIYIEMEQRVQALAAAHKIALSAARHADVLPSGDVRAAAEGFVEAARAAASTNDVPALAERFALVDESAGQVDRAISSSEPAVGELRSSLEKAAEMIDLLGMIAGEGRKAEWENLTAGSQSDFETLIGLILVGAVLVGALGYFVTATIKRVFADVIRINAAIAGGAFDIAIPQGAPGTEAGEMYNALRIFRDNAAERARLEASARTEEAARSARQQHIDARIGDFRRQVQELLGSVAANMDQMQATARQLAHSAGQTSGLASGAASASAQTSDNVQTVAQTTEKLARSIAEINEQVGETTNIVTKATHDARSAKELVASLSESAQRIGEIAGLIRDIAEQTNLLALNATIEAARAGETGRGFAVVASEVKTLAAQTADATEDVAGQIAAIQSATTRTADAIKALSLTMEEVNAYTSFIAASVDRQGEATSEISFNVQQAASETHKVADNVAGVTLAVSETLASAAMVERASADVVKRTADLRQAVNAFLEEVAA